MPYNLSLTAFTQRNFVSDFLPEKCAFRPIRPFCIFQPPLGGLGVAYDVHLRLIVMRILSIVIIELFSLDITAEVLRAKIDWKSAFSKERGEFGPTFQGGGVFTWGIPTNHSSCRKTRMIGLLYGIKYGRSFFRFVTIHAFVRRTERQRTDISLVCIMLTA